jgi:hypothetical protein
MIQKECNVKLNIDTEPDDNLERPITITGTIDNVAIAKEAVFERVAGVNLLISVVEYYGRNSTRTRTKHSNSTMLQRMDKQQQLDSSLIRPLMPLLLAQIPLRITRRKSLILQSTRKDLIQPSMQPKVLIQRSTIMIRKRMPNTMHSTMPARDTNTILTLKELFQR